MSDCVSPDPYDSTYTDESYTDESYTEPSYDSSFDGNMSVDSDGDGFAETTFIDFDGDGVSDAVSTIDAATGAEYVGIDVDMDGQLDTMLVDSDGDGVVDEASSDTDGDGVLDTKLDPETGEPTDEPFVLDPEAVDGSEGTEETPIDDDSVHGDPMAEIPYHQAQVGPNDCLPTSVAMVLTEITGSEVPQGDLVDLANELDLLGPTGMSMEGGLQLLEHYGVDAEVQTGSMDDLRTMLDNGDPIIIGLDSDDLYGEGDAPFTDDLVAGHAVVITGIDDEAGVVYINDPGFPDGAGVAISIEAFEDAWADADNTMIVAEAAGDDAGTAGNVGDSPFGNTDDGDEGLLERIARVVLMPFNLKV